MVFVTHIVVLQKADKRHLDSKVNRNLFDTTCDELNKMINDILCKLSGHVSLSLATDQFYTWGTSVFVLL